MITGTIGPRFELLLRLQVQNPLGRSQDVDVTIDTGYTGVMTVPSALATSLGLLWHSQDSVVLVDGSVQSIGAYAATLIWNGQPRPILAYAIGDTPLIGTGLLVGHDLRARIEPGGFVEIDEIP